ncbi:MAG: hypothetical protein ACFE0I_12305 [Elainellaceae cyanobacterium]
MVWVLVSFVSQSGKMLIPTVSDEEQEAIDYALGSPDDFDEAEFVNLTE